MKRFILATVIFSFLITSSCSKDRIIPKDVLADIYYDMYIIDQTVTASSKLMKASDSLLLYEPVFNRYGYTTQEYLNTVDLYIQRPERFVKIFEETQARLNKEKERLQALVNDISSRKMMYRNFRDSLAARWKTHRASNYEKAVYAFFFVPDSTFCSIPSVDSLASERIYHHLDLYDTVPYPGKDFPFPCFKESSDKKTTLINTKPTIIEKNDKIRK